MKIFNIIILINLIFILFLTSTSASVSTTTSNLDTLPYVETPLFNSHYEAGLFIGETFRFRIQQYIKSYSRIKSKLLPFVRNHNEFYRQLLDQNERMFPHLFAEMKGISHGSQVPLEIITLLNIKPEVDAVLNSNRTYPLPEDLSCSDILYNGDEKAPHSFRALAHNEDANPLIKQYAYLIKLQIRGEPTFTGYFYPGVVGGGTFGFNENGIIITTNAEFPLSLSNTGMARYLLNRQLYNIESVKEGRDMLQFHKNHLVTGFAVNIASLNTKEMENIEIAPGKLSVKPVMNHPYFHVNQYAHLNVPQHVDPSSIHRRAREKELPSPNSKKLIMNILGDTKDSKYPIYRDGTPPDGAATLATAYFDLQKRQLSIYTTNPKTAEYPILELKL